MQISKCALPGGTQRPKQRQFKRIIGTLGNTCGDEVLKKIGRVVREVVRESEIPTRNNGEKFAILLPDTEADKVFRLAQRLGSPIRKLQSAGMQGETINGRTIVATIPSVNVQTYDKLVQHDHTGMYPGKRRGRTASSWMLTERLLTQWGNSPGGCARRIELPEGMAHEGRRTKHFAR